MSGIELKTAIATDVDAIKQCAVAAYSKYIERIGKVPAPMVADFESRILLKQVVVACDEETLVGYVVFYPVDHSMHLENVAVLPAQCGRGIGRLLIGYVESAASKLGLQGLELYTNEAMTENLSMYPALGYQEYDRRCEDGFNRVYYRKRL